MSTPTRERFSREIFDLIIDHAAESSFEDVKVLSLLSKDWLPHTRKILFRRFHISDVVVQCAEDELVKQQANIQGSLSNCLNNENIRRYIKGLIINQNLRWVWSSSGQLHRYPFGNSKDLDGTLPCDLTTLPSTNISFLAYDWMTRSRAEVNLDYSTVFVDILRSCGPNLKHLYLRDAHFYVPRNNTMSEQGFNLFESLAAFAPELESLCLSKISYLPMKLYHGLGDPENLDALRRVLMTPSKAYGSAARGRKIMLKRLYFRTRTLSNKAMEVLLFKNRFLTFDNLVYLALDSISIPLFAGRPLPIMGLKHLTIFDSYEDGRPDDWIYNKARLSLPSLQSLQLVLKSHECILALCQIILGPSAVISLGESGPSQRAKAEYPGEHRFLDFESTIPVADPTCNGIHLHIDLPHINPFHVQFFWRELSPDIHIARIDAMLHSYLIDPSHSDLCMPLASITVSGDTAGFVDQLPLTTSTGRISQTRADFWWDARQW